MRKDFFSLLFFFLSGCSSDPDLDKSNDPVSFQSSNKSSYQSKRSYFLLNKEIKIGESVNEDTTDTGVVSEDTGVALEASVVIKDVSIENLNKNLEMVSSVSNQQMEIGGSDADENNIDISANIVANDVDAGVSDGNIVASADGAKTESTNTDINTEVNVHAITNLDSKVDIDTNPSINTNVNIDSETDVDTGINTVKNTDKKTDGFYTKDHPIQREICAEFLKVNGMNPDLSIKQSVQYFTDQQIQNLLDLNREFPSPKEKEAAVRCFVKTAFSLGRILKITTDSLWENRSVSLTAPHEEILIGFIEHYFVVWLGYGFLSRIKPISSDHIDYVVEEPRLLRRGQYKVSVQFTIIRFYTAKIVWIVDARSFPGELAFIDISFEGVSKLSLLRSQMDYIFQKKNGNLDAIATILQDKMDESSFADL